MTLLAWMAAAQADMDVEVCDGVELDSVQPEHGEAQVPWDLEPLLVVRGCDESASAVVRLYEDDALVLEERLEPGLGTLAHGLDWEGRPDTRYHLRLTPAGGEEVVIDWVTGEEALELSQEPPRILGVTESRQGQTGSMWVEVEPSPQPHGLRSVFEVRDADGEVLDSRFQHEVSRDVSLWASFEGDARFGACVTAHERQPDGSWLDSEAWCEDRVGCSTGAGAAALIPALLGLLALRRRR